MIVRSDPTVKKVLFCIKHTKCHAWSLLVFAQVALFLELQCVSNMTHLSTVAFALPVKMAVKMDSQCEQNRKARNQDNDIS